MWKLWVRVPHQAQKRQYRIVVDCTAFVKRRVCELHVGSNPSIGSKITIPILTIWKVMKVINRERLATLSLFLDTFFNPMGYDALLKMLIDTTGSYWLSISVFYLVSAFWFILYFVFAKVNPLKIFKFKRNT